MLLEKAYSMFYARALLKDAAVLPFDALFQYVCPNLPLGKVGFQVGLLAIQTFLMLIFLILMLMLFNRIYKRRLAIPLLYYVVIHVNVIISCKLYTTMLVVQ